MRILIIAIMLCLPLEGCGLKGPLYLPDQQNQKK